jgi:hypothetical protein
MLSIFIISFLIGLIYFISPMNIESEEGDQQITQAETKSDDYIETHDSSGIIVKKLPTIQHLPFLDDPLNELPNSQDINIEDSKSDYPVDDEQYQSSRGSRADMSESEGNNDFNVADPILDTPMNINSATLQTTSDTDYYKILLDADVNEVDNLTVEVTSLSSTEEWYDYFFVSIFGHYNGEYLHMKTVSINIIDWYNVGDLPPASVNAYAPDWYYIRVTVYNEYYWAQDTVVSYQLRVKTKVDSSVDNNEVPDDADVINKPFYNERLSMASDMFDWFYIEAYDSENYQTNFSLTVDIIKSLKSNSQHAYNQQLQFVTELHVVIYHQDYRGDFEGIELVGNIERRFNMPDPIIYWEHFEKTTDLKFYMGFYVQTYGRNSNGEGDYVWGEGYCDGWVEYSVTILQAKPMIPPLVYNATVTSPVGKIYHTYTYEVSYSDENDDKPQSVRISIDNGKIGPAEMIKVDKSDKNYRDGCLFRFTIDGSEFDTKYEEHIFTITARDIEKFSPPLKGNGPIITENILPTARPSADTIYSIYEDDPVSYLNLNNTFEDADNDTLFYRLSNNGSVWSNIYQSDNVSVKVVTIDGLKYLEFRPKKNRFNRNPGDRFGAEIVYINVSDENPDKDGGINRAHYIPELFELKVIIIGVNDAPRIKKPFSTYFLQGELILEEDNGYFGFDLNKIFWDPIENDHLTFSARNNKNIDVIFYTNGTVDFIPKDNWTGAENIDVIADDGLATVYDSLKVRITPVNDNPVLNYTEKQVINEDEWLNMTFRGYDYADSEQVYYETNLQEILELSDEEFKFDIKTGELSFKPNNNNVGTHKDIRVTVHDYNGGSAEQNVVFEIINTPDPPEPKIISPTPGARYLVTERIDFQSEYYDPDDQIQIEEHTFNWHSDVDGNLSSDPNFKMELSEGEHNIRFKVSDPEFTRSVTVYIYVLSMSKTDTDSDGIPDYWETLNLLNPYDPQDAENDPDRDGFTNKEEYLGLDGKVGGNDDTDPRDPTEHPEVHYKTEKTEEKTYWLEITIIIIVIIILMLFAMVYNRRRIAVQKKKELANKDEKEEIWQDMYGRKYMVHTYEPSEIVCHNCLERMEVKLPIRPLVLTCPKCAARGVLYK